MSDQQIDVEVPDTPIEDVDEPVLQSPDAPDAPSEAETEARRQGWVPKEQYKGDKPWIDAETFVKRGSEINAALRKTNDTLKRDVAEMKETLAEFKKFHAETADRAYKQAMTDLREQKKEAIEKGDGEAVLEIEDKIDDLKGAKPVAPKASEVTAEFREWNEENKWFGTDTELTEEANAIGVALAQSKPNLKGKPFLDEVEKRVRKMFSEKFENQNRGRPNPVEGASGGGKPAGPRGKSFADLPGDAKAACLKFEKQKLMTRDEYVKEYFAGE